MKILAIFNGLVSYLPQHLHNMAGGEWNVITKELVRKSEFASVILQCGARTVGVICRVLQTGQVVFSASLGESKSKAFASYPDTVNWISSQFKYQ